MDVEWLKEQKRARGVTDAAIAGALGVERSVANKVANGRVAVNVRRIGALADLLGVAREEMMFRAGLSDDRPEVVDAPPKLSRSDEINEDIATVGIQHIDMAYGLGATFAVDHPEIEVLQFPEVWVRTITHSPAEMLTWTRGRGDSMEPTIKDGDLIMLDRSQRSVREPDALWAFTVGEIAAIKRLRLKGDRVVIYSDNPAVPPDEEPLSMVNIVGRVIFVGSKK